MFVDGVDTMSREVQSLMIGFINANNIHFNMTFMFVMNEAVRVSCLLYANITVYLF